MDLWDDAEQGLIIPNLVKANVATLEAFLELLALTKSRKKTSKTRANDRSSRSHTIFQINLISYPKDIDYMDDPREVMSTSKVNLVDLSGAERGVTEETTVGTVEEGKQINKSLFALSKCIIALTSQKIGAYIPYRDSKLTRFLKDSLGGSTKTCMVCHISPCFSKFKESAATLKYAELARLIPAIPKDRAKQYKELQQQEYNRMVQDLKKELEGLREFQKNATAGYKPTNVLRPAGGLRNYQPVPATTGEFSPINLQSKNSSARGNQEIPSKVHEMMDQLNILFEEQVDIRKNLCDVDAQNRLNDMLAAKQKEHDIAAGQSIEQGEDVETVFNELKLSTNQNSFIKSHLEEDLMTNQRKITALLKQITLEVGEEKAKTVYTNVIAQQQEQVKKLEMETNLKMYEELNSLLIDKVIGMKSKLREAGRNGTPRLDKLSGTIGEDAYQAGDGNRARSLNTQPRAAPSQGRLPIKASILAGERLPTINRDAPLRKPSFTEAKSKNLGQETLPYLPNGTGELNRTVNSNMFDMDAIKTDGRRYELKGIREEADISPLTETADMLKSSSKKVDSKSSYKGISSKALPDETAHNRVKSLNRKPPPPAPADIKKQADSRKHTAVNTGYKKPSLPSVPLKNPMLRQQPKKLKESEKSVNPSHASRVKHEPKLVENETSKEQVDNLSDSEENQASTAFNEMIKRYPVNAPSPVRGEAVGKIHESKNEIRIDTLSNIRNEEDSYRMSLPTQLEDGKDKLTTGSIAQKSISKKSKEEEDLDNFLIEEGGGAEDDQNHVGPAQPVDFEDNKIHQGKSYVEYLEKLKQKYENEKEAHEKHSQPAASKQQASAPTQETKPKPITEKAQIQEPVQKRKLEVENLPKSIPKREEQKQVKNEEPVHSFNKATQEAAPKATTSNAPSTRVIHTHQVQVPTAPIDIDREDAREYLNELFMDVNQQTMTEGEIQKLVAEEYISELFGVDHLSETGLQVSSSKWKQNNVHSQMPEAESKESVQVKPSIPVKEVQNGVSLYHFTQDSYRSINDPKEIIEQSNSLLKKPLLEQAEAYLDKYELSEEYLKKLVVDPLGNPDRETDIKFGLQVEQEIRWNLNVQWGEEYRLYDGDGNGIYPEGRCVMEAEFLINEGDFLNLLDKNELELFRSFTSKKSKESAPMQKKELVPKISSKVVPTQMHAESPEQKPPKHQNFIEQKPKHKDEASKDSAYKPPPKEAKREKSPKEADPPAKNPAKINEKPKAQQKPLKDHQKEENLKKETVEPTPNPFTSQAKKDKPSTSEHYNPAFKVMEPKDTISSHNNKLREMSILSTPESQFSNPNPQLDLADSKDIIRFDNDPKPVKLDLDGTNNSRDQQASRSANLSSLKGSILDRFLPENRHQLERDRAREREESEERRKQGAGWIDLEKNEIRIDTVSSQQQDKQIGVPDRDDARDGQKRKVLT